MTANAELDVFIQFIDKRFWNGKFEKPCYATKGSAGLDLPACLDGAIFLEPGEEFLIGTGIAIHIPTPDVTGLIFIRSGKSREGLALSNGVGVIDSDYTGEIKASIYNRTKHEIVVNPGDRIVQLVFMPIVKIRTFKETDLPITDRNNNGFGSTGR